VSTSIQSVGESAGPLGAQLWRDYRPEVRALLARLVHAGFELAGLENGGESLACGERSTFGRFVDEATATDDCSLYVRRPDVRGGKRLTVLLVLGNEPGVICADWVSCPALDAVLNAHADEWQDKSQPMMTPDGRPVAEGGR
jgi:hypothetical protein